MTLARPLQKYYICCLLSCRHHWAGSIHPTGQIILDLIAPCQVPDSIGHTSPYPEGLVGIANFTEYGPNDTQTVFHANARLITAGIEF